MIEFVYGCVDTITEPVAVDTGNSSLLSEVQSMFIFPDPVQNELHVRAGLKQTSAGWKLSITDVLGQTIITEPVQLNAGVNTLQVDVSILPAGAFYVSLRIGKTIVTRRFVKDN